MLKNQASATPNTNAASGGSTALDEQRVAIIIPAYNAAATIERAIDSALAQELPREYELEVIVVDDCSSDNTAEIVQALARQHAALTFLQQTQNAGPSAARNRALEATNAVWFTPLDSDDHMLPSRVGSLLRAASSGGWQMVADNLLIAYDDAPQTVVRYLWPDKPAGLVEMTLTSFVTQNLRTVGDRSELGFLKPLIDRRVFGDELIYSADMRFEEDYDLYTRMLAKSARSCLVDPLGYYAVRLENSLSNSQKAIDFERLIRTDRDLLRMAGLSGPARAVIKRHLKENQTEWVWLRAIEAVKTRAFGDLAACFFVSPSSTVYLIGKLLGQVAVRGKQSLSKIDAA